jgi:hypothetical protein
MTMDAPAPPPQGHDSDLDREGILLIALVGVLAATLVVALISSGPEWLAFVGLSVTIVSAVALMRMVTWLMGPAEEDDER